eukprot:4386162-Amphidinium_carterae.2
MRHRGIAQPLPSTGTLPSQPWRQGFGLHRCRGGCSEGSGGAGFHQFLFLWQYCTAIAAIRPMGDLVAST